MFDFVWMYKIAITTHMQEFMQELLNDVSYKNTIVTFLTCGRVITSENWNPRYY